jgi:hypothetical protein
VIDAAEHAPIPGAIVAMEKGGIYRTNPDPSVGNPSYVYGARADDQGTVTMVLDTDFIGVHTFVNGYFYGARLVELDQDVGVTVNMEKFTNKSPPILPPTIQNEALSPSTVAPGAPFTVSADVQKGEATDPLSEEVIITFPKGGTCRALDPPSAGVQGKAFPDGAWSALLTAPDEPGTYEYYLSATSEGCVTSDVKTLTLIVQ